MREAVEAVKEELKGGQVVIRAVTDANVLVSAISTDGTPPA